MNDYYQVDISITPASPDFCDLAAAALADAGYESFVASDAGDTLTAYVPAPLFSQEATAEALDTLVPFASATFAATFVPGRDWNAEWERNYFKPIVVEDRVVVHSSFHADVPKAQFDITIDPKMAFGTGHHATTTLMMRSLLNSPLQGKKVIDMGTGSGILAILASMLGASKVAGVEIDDFALVNARENVALNLPPDKAPVIYGGDALALAKVGFETDFFLANINRNVILADIATYFASTAPGGTLVVSGFYVQDRPVVAEAAAKAGFVAVGADELDNWSSMTFKKL